MFQVPFKQISKCEFSIFPCQDSIQSKVNLYFCMNNSCSYILYADYISINRSKVPPRNPLTVSFPPYLEAVINTAKLTAKVTLSNLFLPISSPSRIDADWGTGRIVAIARGATYKAISPRRLGDSMRMDQPQRTHPTSGPVVASQKFHDLEGNRVGPMRERVRHTPYLQSSIWHLVGIPCE